MKKYLKRIAAAVLLVALLSQPSLAIAQGGGIKYGIDISEWNGVIDWDMAKKDIDFAIIRCGYGRDFVEQDDSMWYINADACTKRDIPFGVYLYSYAFNEEMARSEAEHVLRLVKGYKLSYPIYYDIEDKIQKNMTPEELGAMAEAFCGVIQDAGYEVGVYASQSWWNDRLTDSAFDNPTWYKWVACWLERCTYTGRYNMWQYTDSGSVSGITGRVDMNYWYVEPINNSRPSSLPNRGGERPQLEQEPEEEEVEEAEEVIAETPEATPAKSYVKGYPDGTFKPNGSITRAEAATIISNVFDGEDTDYTLLNEFEDIDETHWAKDSLAFVVAEGYMKGDGKGRFKPDEPITRAELVQLLSNLNVIKENSGEAPVYYDVSNHWAANAIDIMSRNGIVTGYPNQTFGPSNSVTRAEAVTMLSKLFGWSNNSANDKRFSDVSIEHWAFAYIMNAVGD